MGLATSKFSSAAGLASMGLATSKFSSAAGLASMGLATSKFSSAAGLASMGLATSKFNARGPYGTLFDQMARTLTSDLLQDQALVGLLADAQRLQRAPTLVDASELRRLVQRARDAEPEAGMTDAFLRQLTEEAVYAMPAPLAADGLLTDDPALVQAWVTALAVRAWAVLKLEDHHLKEGGLALYMYLLTSSVIWALLLSFPIPAVVIGMLGIGSHEPAKIVANVSRRVYRRFDDDPDGPR